MKKIFALPIAAMMIVITVLTGCGEDYSNLTKNCRETLNTTFAGDYYIGVSSEYAGETTFTETMINKNIRFWSLENSDGKVRIIDNSTVVTFVDDSAKTTVREGAVNDGVFTNEQEFLYSIFTDAIDNGTLEKSGKSGDYRYETFKTNSKGDTWTFYFLDGNLKKITHADSDGKSDAKYEYTIEANAYYMDKVSIDEGYETLDKTN